MLRTRGTMHHRRFQAITFSLLVCTLAPCSATINGTTDDLTTSQDTRSSILAQPNDNFLRALLNSALNSIPVRAITNSQIPIPSRPVPGETSEPVDSELPPLLVSDNQTDLELLQDPFKKSPYKSSSATISSLIGNVFGEVGLQSLPPKELLFGEIPQSNLSQINATDIFVDNEVVTASPDDPILSIDQMLANSKSQLNAVNDITFEVTREELDERVPSEQFQNENESTSNSIGNEPPTDNSTGFSTNENSSPPNSVEVEPLNLNTISRSASNAFESGPIQIVSDANRPTELSPAQDTILSASSANQQQNVQQPQPLLNDNLRNWIRQLIGHDNARVVVLSPEEASRLFPNLLVNPIQLQPQLVSNQQQTLQLINTQQAQANLNAQQNDIWAQLDQNRTIQHVGRFAQSPPLQTNELDSTNNVAPAVRVVASVPESNEIRVNSVDSSSQFENTVDQDNSLTVATPPPQSTNFIDTPSEELSTRFLEPKPRFETQPTNPLPNPDNEEQTFQIVPIATSGQSQVQRNLPRVQPVQPARFINSFTRTITRPLATAVKPKVDFGLRHHQRNRIALPAARRASASALPKLSQPLESPITTTPTTSPPPTSVFVPGYAESHLNNIISLPNYKFYLGKKE